jgi:hypothetical protein
LETTCRWSSCRGCKDCKAQPVMDLCEWWCVDHDLEWSRKCKWATCRGCSACSEAEITSANMMEHK